MIESLILRDPAIKRVGFRASVERASEGQVDLHWLRIIPDAFLVTNGLVVAYEVEDTHRVDASKMKAYAKLWKLLDDVEWEMRLVIMDIRGGTMEADLRAAFWSRP
jgi:hypothetical protein